MSEPFKRLSEWIMPSENPTAVDLSGWNSGKISWVVPTENHVLLEQNPDKINWIVPTENPATVHSLERNPDKIN